MFDYAWDNWGYSVRSLWSWLGEVFQDLYGHMHLNLGWHAREKSTAAATAVDADRPKEKPRPPAGGQLSLN